jgi:hypothetical protein
MFRRHGSPSPQDEPQTVRPDNQLPPGRYFVSHAYEDKEALAALRESLPQDVEPVIFPPIAVPPTQAVSDELISAIVSCQGLVYLSSSVSLDKFWVQFERRYALRRKMPVYGFDPASKRFRADQSDVANLIAPFWNNSIARDRDRALEILEWLQGKRNVHASPISGANTDLTGPDEPASFKRKFDILGGTVVVFVSNESFSRPWPFADADFLNSLDMQKMERFLSCSEVVWLGTPDLGLVHRPYNAFTEAEPTDVLLRRMIGRTVAKGRAIAVESDGEINWNRVDDLLVHIEFWAHQQATLGSDTITEEVRKARLHDAKWELELHSSKKKDPRLL